MINQIIMDMNEHLIESKKSVASAIADSRRLERQVRDNQTKAKEWEDRAVLAVKAGKDDLAREALVRKQEYDNYVKELHPQWTAQQEAVNELKETLKALQRKIEEAQRKKNILIARTRRAETKKKLQAMTSNISDNSAFEAFDRMTAKVEHMEAEADAIAEMNRPDSADNLEAEFRKLESADDNVDRQLEELKEKLKRIEDSSGDK
jgi:phage shock protein A